MRRRRYLAAVGGAAAVGSGGWLAYRAGQRRRLSTASLRTYDLAVRITEAGGRAARAHSTDEWDDPDVFERAVDGEYRTNDPDPWLIEYLNHHDFVEHGGTIYRLSDALPSLVIGAAPVDPRDVDGRVADERALREAAGSFHVGSSFLAAARLDGVRVRAPDDDLRAFFDGHAALRVFDSHYALETRFRDSGPPYTVAAEPVTERAYMDARTVDLSAAGDAVTDGIRGAIDGDGSVHGVSGADGDRSLRLQVADFVRLDGTRYAIDAWSVAPAPLAFSAEVTEAGVGFKDPGRIGFAVENTGDRPVTLSGGTPLPFGELAMAPVDGGTERHLYPVDGGGSSVWPARTSDDVGREAELAPGQRATVEYAVGGDVAEVPAGEYVARGEFRTAASLGGRRVPFDGRIRIE